MAVAGDSVGGNMSIALTLMAKSDPGGASPAVDERRRTGRSPAPLPAQDDAVRSTSCRHPQALGALSLMETQITRRSWWPGA